MATQRTPMTAEGIVALRSELEQLETTARDDMARQIRTAREFGDLKENAEYHAAKEAQAHLETRILRLRDRLASAEVVEAAGGGMVGFGSTVEVEDEQTGKRSTYELVSAMDASAAEGRISWEAPVAVALRDRRAGDVAAVQTPRGERRLRLISVR